MSEPRFKYRSIAASDGGTLVLRDDGYRIHVLWLPPDVEWHLWAEYKQCDLVGASEEIARALMEGD